MDVLNPMTYDAEEDQLRDRTKYSQMDRLIIPAEFQQQPVSTGVSEGMDGGRKNAWISFRRPSWLLNMMEVLLSVLIHELHLGRKKLHWND